MSKSEIQSEIKKVLNDSPPGGYYLKELKEQVGVSRPTLRTNLAVLKAQNEITINKRGTSKFVRLSEDSDDEKREANKL